MGVVTSDDHHAMNIGEVAFHSREVFGKFFVNDQHIGLGIVDDVSHLDGGESPVNGHRYRIHETASKR